MRRSSVARRTRIVPVVAAAAAAMAFVAPHAGGDTLTVESFTGAAVSDSTAWVSGGTGGSFTGWPGKACLTAGADTAQTPIAGCGLEPPDAEGSGALRLTPATTGRAGFALYNQPLPTTGGLDISFRQAQWGGTGADGISFFLVEGSTNLVQPGQAGGSLGYAPGGGGPGVANGLVGVGIDTWGNFSTPGGAGTGCAPGTGPGSAGPGPAPNRVVVRGPGNGTVGYCFLATSGAVGNLSDATRAAATKTVRVVFDPGTVADRKVTVYLDGVQVVQIDAPQALIDATTFKFGFGAATGDVTNNHEVWNLTIESVEPIEPVEPGPLTTVDATPRFPG